MLLWKLTEIDVSLKKRYRRFFLKKNTIEQGYYFIIPVPNNFAPITLRQRVGFKYEW